MNSAVSLKVGPIISFMLAPGAFVTISPYVIGQASLYGDMNYGKSSGSMPSGTPVVKWPKEISCNAESPDAKSHRRRQADTKHSSTHTAGSTATGVGFEIPVADFNPKGLDNNTYCLA